MCEMHDQCDPRLEMSQGAYLDIQRTFNLSPATLPALFAFQGVHSSHTTYDETGKPKTLQIVMKVTQKIEIANSTLSLCYDFKSRWTTAFLCGEGVTTKQWVDVTYGSRLKHMIGILQSCIQMWTHPLLIPAALIHGTCDRTETRLSELSDEVVGLEEALGVTDAGQARGQMLEACTCEEQGFVKGSKSCDHCKWPDGLNVKGVLAGLNATSAQLVFVGHVVGWEADCVEFLMELGKELDQIGGVVPGYRSSGLRQFLEHERASILSMGRFLQGYKERVQTQLSVVRPFP
jgi:hypothetical protein